MPYQPGDILLDKYRIEELIGKGAFAQVYRVTHLALNVTRAVKVLRRDTPGVGSTEYSDFRERFRLEAQLGARLNTPTSHTNLLHIYDFQQVDDLLVLEMEYASGGSLTERLEKAKESNQPIPIDEAVQMGRDVAQGLAAIHALDAVHRDLKPSNILFDSRGTAKVADLGLAQIPGGPSMRSKLSQAEPHPGTSGYMSPEQTDTSMYLTPASDVYALGLVLFEILIIRMYRSIRPGTPVRVLREDVPIWLDNLLERMLAEEPKGRPWDGAELAELLCQGQDADSRREEEQQRKGVDQTQHGEGQVPIGGGWKAVIPTWGWWTGGLIGLVILIFIIFQLINNDGNGTPTPTRTQPTVVAEATFTPQPAGLSDTKTAQPESPTATQAAAQDENITPEVPSEITRYDVPVDDDPFFGPVAAPITIIEFADYECPYCRRWHQEVFPRLIEEYPEQIRLVYRDFPLTSIHSNAVPAAMAANCAGDQDAYWEFNELLFGSELGLGTDAYQDYASGIGLDIDTFRECMESNRYEDEVMADYQYASTLGVRSTPTFFVNGIALIGAQTFEVFKQVIDQELAGELD